MGRERGVEAVARPTESQKKKKRLDDDVVKLTRVGKVLRKVEEEEVVRPCLIPHPAESPGVSRMRGCQMDPRGLLHSQHRLVSHQLGMRDRGPCQDHRYLYRTLQRYCSLTLCPSSFERGAHPCGGRLNH